MTKKLLTGHVASALPRLILHELLLSTGFLGHLSHSDKVSFCDRSLSIVRPSVAR